MRLLRATLLLFFALASSASIAAGIPSDWWGKTFVLQGVWTVVSAGRDFSSNHRQRIYFSSQGRIFVTDGDGEGAVIPPGKLEVRGFRTSGEFSMNYHAKVTLTRGGFTLFYELEPGDLFSRWEVAVSGSSCTIKKFSYGMADKVTIGRCEVKNGPP
jgi:hypothetical protein